MKKIAAITALVLALVLLLTACGNKIEGKWKTSQQGVTIIFEFKSNNEFIGTTSYEGQSENVKGTYQTDGNKVIITADGETQEFTYKVSGKKLTLTVDSTSIEFTKQ